LSGLPLCYDPNLLAGIEHAEDAGVYKLSEELAIIQTLDFFTPIVDNPYDFGQIAVANSLSDVYAMGGKPLTAMNIVCFPRKTMSMDILKEVLAGGLAKMHEAGVVLLGGHSVEDPEMKYGLSVTGTIHPKKVLYNSGAKAGDSLILTKKLGTGIISTAIKKGAASEEAIGKITASMAELNRTAAELMAQTEVHACTDVTGFGLVGHGAEMVEASGVSMAISAETLPLFAEAQEYAKMGMIPGGLHRNRDYRKHMVVIGKDVPQYLADIIYDPQTSGGLLIALPQDKADDLIKEMHANNLSAAAIIGEITSAPKNKLFIS